MKKDPIGMPLEEARAIAEDIVKDLRRCCSAIMITGSIRREAKKVHDIDLLVLACPSQERDLFGQPITSTNALDDAMPALQAKWHAHKIAAGPQEKLLLLPKGLKLEIRVSTPASWAVELVIRTGPEDFTHKCVTKRMYAGYLPSNCQIKNGWLVYRGATIIPMASEMDFLNFLELGWIEPRDRR
jgi:DNA polymerase/3'-5' exonuclease PolX